MGGFNGIFVSPIVASGLGLSGLALAADGDSLAPVGSGVWLTGDLHAHSTYSDGDSSVAAVIGNVERLGFDFFALSDHDHKDMKGVITHWFDPGFRSEKLVLLHAVEWSTRYGHANLFSTRPFPYEEFWQANRAKDSTWMHDIAARENLFVSVNHPIAYRGISWRLPVDDRLEAVEIWNSTYRFIVRNTGSVHGFWDDLLKKGRRVVGLGGGDTHFLKGPLKYVVQHGVPSTWVFSEDKTAEGLLAAMRAGHVSVSYAIGVPRLELLADRDRDGLFDTLMGDSLVVGEGEEVDFCARGVAPSQRQMKRGCDTTAQERELDPAVLSALRGRYPATQKVLDASFRVLGRPKAMVALVRNGEVERAWSVGGMEFSFPFSVASRGASSYYRLEVVGKSEFSWLKKLIFSGNTLAVSNPIYFNY